MSDHIHFLLDYCMDKPELYNDVSTRLWVQFGIQNAELTLLCTYIANEVMKGKTNNGDKGKNKKTG